MASPSEPSTADLSQAAPPAEATKLDFELHVALIMRANKVAKSKALFTAYCEGPKGLYKRLLKS